MRKLVVVRGAPGSGKSTVLKQLGLTPWVLSMDAIRQVLGGMEMTSRGDLTQSQSQNNKVFAFFTQWAGERMERGELLALDATFSMARDFQWIFEQAKLHRYQILCLDFGNLPLDVLIRRDAARLLGSKVGEGVVRLVHRDLKNSPRPDHPLMTVLDFSTEDSTLLLEQAKAWLSVPLLDFSAYREVVHIGDLQGCFSVLTGPDGPLAHGFKDDIRYVFVGDYLDRGIENGLLLQWLLDEAVPRKNVDLLWGNHELHLHRWASGLPHLSAEFQDKTLPQLKKQGLTAQDADRLVRKLKEVLAYRYHDRRVMVTHAGLSSVPERFEEISLEQYSHGTGHWENPVGDQFHRQAPAGWEQVHGHRNHGFKPIQSTPRTFCLEGGVEGGGELRVATLNRSGWSTGAYRNWVYSPFRERRSAFTRTLEAPWISLPDQTRMGDEVWESMIKHPGVRTMSSKSSPHIVSLNFTRDVFFQKSWDDVVVKARGLFVNKESRKIVARGYEKFFNVGERDETELPRLVNETLTFPISLYLKENGFLGNLGYDDQTENLFVSSKSTPDGDFAGYFREILERTVSPEIRESIRRYLRDQEASMVFEVIDPVRDPHMIEYESPHLVLLDVFQRSSEVRRLPYEDLKTIAAHFQLRVKERAISFKDAASFTGWLSAATEDLSWRFKGKDVEGFVIEDEKGYQTKVKLPHYSFWKKMRGTKDRVFRLAEKIEMARISREKRTAVINERRSSSGLPPLDEAREKLREEEELLAIVNRDPHPLARAFTQWCIEQKPDVLKQDIIALRRAFRSQVGITDQDLKTPWQGFDPSETEDEKPAVKGKAGKPFAV